MIVCESPSPLSGMIHFAFGILHFAFCITSSPATQTRTPRCAGASADAGLIDEAAGQRAFTCEHGDILLAVHGIRDGAVLNRSLQRRSPTASFRSRHRTRELSVEIAPEHEISGGREHRAVSGRRPL